MTACLVVGEPTEKSTAMNAMNHKKAGDLGADVKIFNLFSD
jgi:hypothetical protein